MFLPLKQQLETTKIEEVKEMDYVIILDPPEVPLQRSKPNKKQMVIVAGIIGLGLGMVFAFIRQFIANRNKEGMIKFLKPNCCFLKVFLISFHGNKNKKLLEKIRVCL